MKYTGGCHCGNVKFEVEMEIAKVVSCNCTICSKRGSLLAFASAENFTLIRGEEFLKDYQFGKKRIHHLFCSNCGVSSFGKGVSPKGQEMRAINVRCLDGVNIEQFEVMKFDGLSL